MSRLSSPIDSIQKHYDVIVIGSGYGGAIAASRLSRAGKSVCLLERGKEIRPGEFPDTETEALEEVQFDLPDCHLGKQTGLYDFRVNRDINVLQGCGLGGTSLINANVCIEPEERVFQDPVWPEQVRTDFSAGQIQQYVDHAKEMLKPVCYPGNETRPKYEALRQSGAALNEPVVRAPINVTFKSGVNHVGVQQYACNDCGDCVSGCNYSAKNTTLMNYLPDAHNHGAAIFTRTSVRYIKKHPSGWKVYFQVLDTGREKFDAPEQMVSADMVILSAGALGSTEILLRSREQGLALSDALGRRFSGNGDMLGFAYNNEVAINGVGFGHRDPSKAEPVGPCIMGIVDARNQPDLNDGMVIEDGSPPGTVASLLPPVLAKASALLGKDTDGGLADKIEEEYREQMGRFHKAYRNAALKNTQTFLVMSHDDSGGHMTLENDRLRIHWPGVGEQPIFEKNSKKLYQATVPLGGTYLKNPIWSETLGHDLITVHPLGGCVMSETAAGGVVNHKGQVFSGSKGSEVYESLYVMDGAVLPRSVGINPLLTISALAERSCALLAQDRDWVIDYTLPSAPVAGQNETKPGIQFTEKMTGWFSVNEKEDYAAGRDRGEEEGSPFEFVLTVTSEDVEDMLDDPEHPARMTGTVKAPALSPNPLTVVDGYFNLFTESLDGVDTRLMQYRMQLVADNGDAWFFEGFKSIKDDPGFDLWSDTTTLYITVHKNQEPQSPVLGKGILVIKPADFMRQMTTMKVLNVASSEQRLKYLAQFGLFFAGVLYHTYGGVFAPEESFNPQAPPRKKRPLNVSAPETHWFKTSDNVNLRLLRYQGGDKGPVVLFHGLGVSSRIFSIDTIDVNLLEYLYAAGFDVWLVDYRMSIELPSAGLPNNLDVVAAVDLPESVAKIRSLTGSDSVQVIAHCAGAVAFVMAMLSGMQGVRCAVLSQIAAHVLVTLLPKLKAYSRMPEALNWLGVDSLTAYTDQHADFFERLYNQALRFYPVDLDERCNNPVCHRISFMYSLLYEHKQLNALTHQFGLHEMFGVANIKAFEHLAYIIKNKKVVDANGRDLYLSSLEGLNIPLTFIHGGENSLYLPKSTELTYNLLRNQFGKEKFKRHVIPGYGHLDCIFGKNAVRDVYPYILEGLEV